MFQKKDDKQQCECEKLKKDLEAAKKKADENLIGWKRALADYTNFKKEQEAKRADFVNFANADLILEILPILDNFNAAWKSLPSDSQKNPWVVGFGHIKSQLENLLKDRGVEEIGKVGEEFEPEKHEAVERAKDGKTVTIETLKYSEALKVTGVVQKGYKLQGKVIRPAKVKVS